MDRYKLTDETMTYCGVTLRRVLWLKDNRLGGWISDDAVMPQGGTAVLYGDAKIIGGTIEGGTIKGGTIKGGTIWGGTIEGGTFYTSPCCAQRSDGYMFVAKHVDGDLRIWAGCRDFSWGEAVAHWNDAHRHGAETQRIIHFLKAQAEAEKARDDARVTE